MPTVCHVMCAFDSVFTKLILQLAMIVSDFNTKNALLALYSNAKNQCTAFFKNLILLQCEAHLHCASGGVAKVPRQQQRKRRQLQKCLSRTEFQRQNTTQNVKYRKRPNPSTGPSCTIALSALQTFKWILLNQKYEYYFKTINFDLPLWAMTITIILLKEAKNCCA